MAADVARCTPIWAAAAHCPGEPHQSATSHLAHPNTRPQQSGGAFGVDHSHAKPQTATSAAPQDALGAAAQADPDPGAAAAVDARRAATEGAAAGEQPHAAPHRALRPQPENKPSP